MNRETTRDDHTHCDPEVLALAALGERTDIDTEHLGVCDRCQADLASLRRIVRITRSDDATDITSPAPSVWEAISTQISAESTVENSAENSAGVKATVNAGTKQDALNGEHPVDDLADQRTQTGRHQMPAGPTGDDSGVVVPLRRRPASWLAAAAAVGVVLGGAGTVAWTQSTDPQSTIVAQTSLQPLPGFTSTGVARVQTTATGDAVTVDLKGLPATDGYYEVWLLTEDGSAMVSLGAVGSTETSTLPLPPGIALDRFRIVDISAEEFDGDPTHSTISVARGDLQA